MRKCLRCQTIGKPKAAICQNCGEESIYIKNVEDLKQDSQVNGQGALISIESGTVVQEGV